VQRYETYYDGEFHSHPASFLAYELAEAVSRGRNDLLWLAILGVTEVGVLEPFPGLQLQPLLLFSLGSPFLCSTFWKTTSARNSTMHARSTCRRTFAPAMQTSEQSTLCTQAQLPAGASYHHLSLQRLLFWL